MTIQQRLDDELIANQDSIDQAMMIQLATSNDSKLIVDDLMSQDIPTQLRAFTILKARNELLRIIKISDTLRKLEDSYLARAVEDRNGMDLKSFAKVIETASGILKRSMDLVYNVINDKELKLVIEQTNNIYNDNRSQTAVISPIQNQEAREKLRNIATRLLNTISENPSSIVTLEAGSTDDDNDIDSVIEIDESIDESVEVS